MNAHRRSGPRPTLGRGRTWRTPMVLIVVILGLAALSLAYLLISTRSSKDVSETADMSAESPETRLPGSTQDLSSGLPPGIDPNGEMSPEVLSHFARAEIRSISEWIERLHEAGIYSGIGAFNPPGTSPPMIGLAVPEDYVLPTGYVRHHQATDDGQRIEAILMFDPDFHPKDVHNRPIPLPKDLVVTPELAPLNFPIRKIVLPAPIKQEGTGL